MLEGVAVGDAVVGSREEGIPGSVGVHQARDRHGGGFHPFAGGGEGGGALLAVGADDKLLALGD